MPRYPNYPTTCEGTQRLELAYLRKIGVLQPGIYSRTLSWSNRGQPSGSIGLDAHIEPGESNYLRLYYTVNKERHYDYTVQLEQQPSNLRGVAGYRWYMVCPITGRRATVLYLRSGTGVFAHRLAFPQERLYYDAQLENKRFRGLSNYFGVDKEWEEQYRKGRKLFYQGKPTRWHERLLKLERQTDAAAPALLRMLQGITG
jgi:hypothetical protein